MSKSLIILNNLVFQVWDIMDLVCVRNYVAAHSAMIYAVSVKPKSTSCFATGSMDQCVTLWDDKVERPVLGQSEKVFCLKYLKILFGNGFQMFTLLYIFSNLL